MANKPVKLDSPYTSPTTNRIFEYRCNCPNGSLACYTNDPNLNCSPCISSNCFGGQVYGGGSRPSFGGFRNMEGNKFSAKNLLIFAAIGAAAFFAYKKFVK